VMEVRGDEVDADVGTVLDSLDQRIANGE